MNLCQKCGCDCVCSELTTRRQYKRRGRPFQRNVATTAQPFTNSHKFYHKNQRGEDDAPCRLFREHLQSCPLTDTPCDQSEFEELDDEEEEEHYEGRFQKKEIIPYKCSTVEKRDRVRHDISRGKEDDFRVWRNCRESVRPKKQYDTRISHHRSFQPRPRARCSPEDKQIPYPRPRYIQESFLDQERRYRETPADIVNRPNPDFDPYEYELQQRRFAYNEEKNRKRDEPKYYQPITEGGDNFRHPFPSSQRNETSKRQLHRRRHNYESNRREKSWGDDEHDTRSQHSSTPLPQSYLEYEHKERSAALEERQRRLEWEIQNQDPKPSNFESERWEYDSNSNEFDQTNYSPPPAPQRQTFSKERHHEVSTRNDKSKSPKARTVISTTKHESVPKRTTTLEEAPPFKFNEPNERFETQHHARSSHSLLNKIKPVQRMRQEWEARMKEIDQKVDEAKKSPLPISKPPKKFTLKERDEEDVSKDTKVILTNLTPTRDTNTPFEAMVVAGKNIENLSIASGRSRKSEKSYGKRASREQLVGMKVATFLDDVRIDKGTLTSLSQEQRDSYIESEGIKKLLNDDSQEKFVEPRCDLEQLQLSKVKERSISPPPRRVSNLKHYVEKWKGYRKVTRISPHPKKPQDVKPILMNGLTFLEFNEPRTQVEKLTHTKETLKIETKVKVEVFESNESTTSMKEEASPMPVPLPPPPPPSTWWNYFSWGATTPALQALPMVIDTKAEEEWRGERDGEQKSFHSSSGTDSSISFAMGIQGQEIRRANGESLTLDMLKPLNEDYDQIVKSDGEAMAFDLSDSRLETNIPFQHMKSVSHANIFNRKSTVDLSQPYQSTSQHCIYHFCQMCKKLINQNEGEKEIIADGVHWHERCFICSICGNALNENNHFWQDGHVYCVVHYAQKIDAPRCAKCHQYIFETVYTHAKGRAWHKHHFQCTSCKEPIIDTKYITRKHTDIICFECHGKYYSHTCEACKKPILPTEQFVHLTAPDNYWHANDSCLQCGTCHQSLVAKSKKRLIFLKNGIPFCNTYCAQISPIDK